MSTAKIKTLLSLIAASVLSIASIALITSEVDATDNCVSEKCIAAEKAEKEAMEKATNATNAAKTLEGEVARLNDEISALQARIKASEARSEDLKVLIAENTKKLKDQQAALANMLVEAHFEGQPEAIMILAGSSSISDYAEKQSRVDTVKTQINLSAQAVKALKEQLEAQKTEIEGIITDQKLQQSAIATKKNQQTELVNKYKGNAEAYASEAEEARKIKEAEIANEIAKYHSSGVVVAGGINSYPWASQCPGANLSFSTVGGYVCQCTSYAGYKFQERWGYSILSWGNAYDWADSARASGFRVDHEPSLHSIAVSQDGVYGHVMWVEGVNSSDSINISEYNNWYSATPNRMGDFGMRNNVSPYDAGQHPYDGSYKWFFIHFD